MSETNQLLLQSLLAEQFTYEVSLWTLQDKFLTVLKWANIDVKGLILSPEVTISDDGTREFKFSIPKFYYLYKNKTFNPLWLKVLDSPIEANMHKLKLIFNKMTEDEAIEEFLVTSVVETHSLDNIVIEVSAEGLAFHELGKIGYKISLSADDFNEDSYLWFVQGMEGDEPKNNIQYWNDKVFKNDNGNWRLDWTYEVCMDWSAYSQASLKDSSVIYEDEYIASWLLGADDKFVPKNIEEYREKYRYVEAEESNIYNITQDIAKVFGVFCKYEYEHDALYYITGKKVVYYNNYLLEVNIDGNLATTHLDLTYPYSSSSIKRTVDSTDITTKMFVRTVEDNAEDTNIISIMNVEANKSKEDYILNFDYLHEIGTISDDLYDAINTYEAAMHAINSLLISIENLMMIFLNELTEVSAKATYYHNALLLDIELYNNALALRSALTGGTNYIPIDDITPRRFTIYTDKSGSRGHYIKLDIQGLDPNSIRLYTIFDDTALSGNRLSGQLTSYLCIFDEYNNVTGIDNILFPKNSSGQELVSTSIRLTGMYSPQLYYDNIARVWAAREGEDSDAYNAAFEKENNLAWYLYGARADYGRVDAARVGGERINTIARIEKTFIDLCRVVLENRVTYDSVKDEYSTTFDDVISYTPDLVYTQEVILREKRQTIDAFERMMGPALREGYWQPEDYNDYGDKYLDTFTINSNRITPLHSHLVSFIWDGDERFDGEKGVLFLSSVSGDMELYPIIDISNALDQLSIYDLDTLSFIYYDKVAVDTITEIVETIASLELNPTATSSLLINELLERIDELKHSNLIRSFTVGSQCEFGFILDNDSYKPVLILTDSTLLTAELIAQFTDISTPNLYRPFIGIRDVSVAEDNTSVEETITAVVRNLTFIGTAGVTLTGITDETYEIKRVYPRIFINSLKLNNNSEELLINLNNTNLIEYEDYYVLVDERGESEDSFTAGYYITLKPHTIINEGDRELKVDISFVLSNADIAIYLDAMKIAKENAYPKVSYDIELCALDYNLLRTAYQKLNYIVHINDLDLLLLNVCGYISSITIPLDKVWETSAEIKNYETKFEDLFSTIVAQTESMLKNEFAIGNIANAFTVSGVINDEVLLLSIMRADLNYSFNQGTLTIDLANGIWGTSPDGVVAFRGGGIFTATSKDDDGNWKWNTGILPSGINANLITSGLLDTDKIRIFAGDQILFLLNGEGLFAYKSFINDRLDPSEYVVFNLNGVFLKNTVTYTDDNNVEITTDSSRVEISWDGLIIRNNRDEKVFYADNEGNLRLTGIITARGGSIGGWEIQEGRLHNTYIDLISNSEDGKIELTNEILQVSYVINENGINYYLYKNRINDDISYYIPEDNLLSAPLSLINNPSTYYVYELLNVGVSPKYTWVSEVITTGDILTSGAEGDEQLISTQDVTVTTIIYIVGMQDSTVPLQDSLGNPIVYTGGNSLDSAWYTKLLSNSSYSLYLNNYVDYVQENKLIMKNNDDDSLTLILQQYKPIFSVSAKTGIVIIPQGNIGSFNLTSNTLSSDYNMSISSTNLSGDNYVDGNANYALSKYKDCFCSFEPDSTKGTFTLTTVGGGRVTFNIASTNFYKTKLAEAGKLKNAKTSRSGNHIIFEIESGYGNKYSTSYNASSIYNAGFEAGKQENTISLGTYRATWSSNATYKPTATEGSAWNALNITVSVRTYSSGTTSSSTCFAAGTKIKLYDQTEVPIEKLLMGMQVLAYDEENEQFYPSEIMGVSQFHNVINIYDVYLSSGKILTLTSSHPLLTVDGWKAIDIELASLEHEIYMEELHIGDVVISENEYITITNIVQRKDLDGSTVYNIDVEPIDTYMAEGVVVHNKK